MTLRSDRRSPQAAAYRKLYNSKRWREIRARQLAVNPLCAMCKAAGRITPATVCDHVTPHRGDLFRFWHGPFQSLCDDPRYRCHSSTKQSEEACGYSQAIGEDGLPTDPRHPFNAPG